MTQLAILVAFRVTPEARDQFHRLVTENAAASLRDEAGCRRFDVLVPESSPDGRFVLYEIYDDDAAFQAHLASAHYRTFDQATARMVVEKRIERLNFA